MSRVLDSSVVIAFVHKEPGGDRLGDSLAGFRISSINYSETMGVLLRGDRALPDVRDMLRALDLNIVAFDRELAEATATLIIPTRRAGLSLGDRACLALAAREHLPAVTADRKWRGLDVGVEIEFIR